MSLNPTYCYRCPKCGNEEERSVPMSQRLKQACGNCGAPLKQVPATCQVLFKGSGWAKDNYGGSKESYGKKDSSE